VKNIINNIIFVSFLYLYTGVGVQAQQHTYVNESIGIKVSLPENWQIFTEHDAAPSAFKNQLPKNKGENDSPLFFALTDNQQMFARLLVEKSNYKLDDYFFLLAASIESEEAEIVSAKWVPERNSIQWEYRLNQPNKFKILFRERLTITEDGYVLRLGIWSLEPFMHKYSDEINALFHGVEFRKQKNVQDKLKKTWAGLEALLPQENIKGINIATAKKKMALVCKDDSSTLLWKIEDADNVVYLFGSLHVGQPDFYPLADEIEKAFKDSEHLVVEVNTESDEAKRVISSIQERGSLKDGEKLSDILSEPVFTNLIQVFLYAIIANKPHVCILQLRNHYR